MLYASLCVAKSVSGVLRVVPTKENISWAQKYFPCLTLRCTPAKMVLFFVKKVWRRY